MGKNSEAAREARDVRGSAGQSKAFLVTFAAGLLFGLACALADQLPYSPHLLLVAPVWLGNIAGLWLVAAFAAGALAPSLRVARLAAPLLLVSAVLAYYGFIVLAGTRASVALPTLLSTAVIWLLLGVGAGLVFGWLGFRWRKGTVRERRLLLSVVGLCLVVESLGYLLRAVPSPTNPYFVLYSIELAAGLLLPWLLARRPSGTVPRTARTPSQSG